MYNPLRVLRFVRDAQSSGKKAALVTIVETTGASARSPGAMLAVDEDGRYAGALTGGCIEAAVAAEALRALCEGRPREVRFGEGSPYVDIRLPCGGGLDLLFTPLADEKTGERAVEILEGRRALRLTLPRARAGAESSGSPRLETTTEIPAFRLEPNSAVVGCIPPLRLALFGRGEVLERLRDLCLAIGAEPFVHSPDADLLTRSADVGVRIAPLVGPDRLPPIELDRFAAAVLLFHDHDWEPPILARVLKSEAFFIGAMGSRAAHASRCEALHRLGHSESEIARIAAPVGLIPAMRDPETLAVSVLAEIVARFDEICLKPPSA